MIQIFRPFSPKMAISPHFFFPRCPLPQRSDAKQRRRDVTGAAPAVRLPVPLFHGASHARRPGGDPAERRHPTPDLGHEQLPPGRREGRDNGRSLGSGKFREKKDQEAVGDVAFNMNIWYQKWIYIYIYIYLFIYLFIYL